MNNNYTVYVHIFPNSKRYIGITSKKPQYRWNNGNGYKNNIYMERAIKKYGWENIKHEILYENLSKDEAEQHEIELIAYYKSNQIKFGYNIQNGGNCKGSISDETRKKLSKNNARYWLGKHLSNETKKKLSYAHKGKKMSDESKIKMKETLIKNGIMYATPEEKILARRKQASEYKKRNREKILLYYKDYQKSHRKFKDGEKRVLSQEHKNKLSISHLGKRAKKVLCYDKNNNFIKEYSSITNAHKETNADIGGIVRCCKELQHSAGGYIWKYN